MNLMSLEVVFKYALLGIIFIYTYVHTYAWLPSFQPLVGTVRKLPYNISVCYVKHAYYILLPKGNVIITY